MRLICYPTVNRPPELVPGRANRDWMDAFPARHPYRCLPLSVANTTGWELLSPADIAIEWNGGPTQNDITITAEKPFADLHHFCQSHFAGGVVTFHPGYLFKTEPGWAMWASGPPNHVKDGIQPLAGLTETDWLPFPFTMNWIFTRPGRVRFRRDEPFCFITLVEHRRLDAVEPVIRSLDRDPELKHQYDVWNRERSNFNHRLNLGDPETVKESWQRFYFKGELPPQIDAKAPEDHVNKRRLKPPRFEF